jgi:hypothetical protein
MAVPERDDSCKLTWNPSGLTLEDLASFTSLLFELHKEVACPFRGPGELRFRVPGSACWFG